MKKPFVVAIAGGTCSGKSTMSHAVHDEISKDINAKLIGIDAYMKKDPPTVIAPITRIEYVEHNHPDGIYMEKFLSDFEEALNSDCDVLIIEGLFALYIDKVRESADFKIYVDLDSDARLVRRIKRHMSWGESYEEVTQRYIDTVRFRHDELVEPTRWHADLIANGTLSDNKSIDIAVKYILSQLK